MKKIIDQNYLGAPNKDLEKYLKNSNFVVLSDYACMEMYKGESVKNLRKSLEILKNHPRQVLILKNTSQIIKMDNMKGKGLQKRLVDESMTTAFKEFCDDVYSTKILDSKNWQSYVFRKLSIEANTFFTSRDKDTKEVLKGILEEQNTFSKDDLEILRKEKNILSILNRKKERVLLLTAKLYKNRKAVPQKFDKVKYSYVFRF